MRDLLLTSDFQQQLFLKLIPERFLQYPAIK